MKRILAALGLIAFVATAALAQSVSTSPPIATTSNFGIVKPDGSTITISGGVISSSGGGSAAYTLISSIPTTSGNSVTLTGITSTELIAVINGVAVTNTPVLQFSPSINGGSTYGTARTIIPAAGNFGTTPTFGSVIFFGSLKSGYFQTFGGGSNISTTSFGVNAGYIVTSPSLTIFNIGSQVNAIKFSLSGSETFSAGSIDVYGR